MEGEVKRYTRTNVVLLSVLALSLLLRLCYIFSQPNELSVLRDGHHYVSIAENLRANHSYEDSYAGTDRGLHPLFSDISPTAFWLPGYPFFLSFVFTVFGTSPRTVYVLQALMSVVAVFVCFRSAGLLFQSRSALTAAALMGISPYQIFYTRQIMTEGLGSLVLVSTVYVTLKIAKSLKEREHWPLGLSLALAVILSVGVLTRQVFVFVALGTFLWVALLCANKSRTGKKCDSTLEPDFPPSIKRTGNRFSAFKPLLYPSFLFLLVLLLVSPWFVRNYGIWGKAIYETQMGLNMYMGFNDKATGNIDLESVPYLDPKKYDEVTRDEIYKAWTRDWVTKHPVRSGALFLKKLLLLYDPVPTAPGSTKVIGLVWWLFLLSLAGAGIVFGLRNMERFQYLYIVLIFYTLPHGLAFAGIRFRVPLEVILILFATLGLDAITRIRNRTGGASKSWAAIAQPRQGL
jgi:4-amino-4-deoxy-L-arabinose transferase-like glycosyltransferase